MNNNSIPPNIQLIWNDIKHLFDEKKLDISKLIKQLQFFDIWRRKYKYVGYLEACTGFGKTMVGLISCLRLNIFKPDATIIIIVPNTNLYNDWCDPHKGYINMFNLKNINVYVVNTYTMSNKNYNCDFLLLDEIHRYLNEESLYFSKAIEKTTFKHLLGLTATLNDKQKSFLIKYNIKRIGEVLLEEAEAKGWISNFIIYNYSVELQDIDVKELEDLNKKFQFYFKKFNSDFNLLMGCNCANNKYYKYKTGEQWRNSHSNNMGWDGMNDDHEYSPKNIRKYAGLCLKYMIDRKSYINKCKTKTDAVEEIINYLNKKTIVFSQLTETIEDLNKKLGKYSRVYHSNLPTIIHENKESNNIIAIKSDEKSLYILKDGSNKKLTFKELKLLYPSCVRLGGNKLKNKIKDDFKNNKFKYLLTSQALNEGFDSVDTEVGIIHSGESNQRVFKQRIGRIIRANGNKSSIIINIYIKNSQDEVWLRKKQSSIPKNKIIWVDKLEDIKTVNENSILIK
jgi:superfamily II DNA or RNA helicase